MDNLKTVLIVDDAFINRALLKKLLSGSYNVIEAEDGKQALETLRKDPQSVSCVLLDLDMPVMSGYEVLSAVRMDQQLNKIPIVVTTSGDDPLKIKINTVNRDCSGKWVGLVRDADKPITFNIPSE